MTKRSGVTEAYNFHGVGRHPMTLLDDKFAHLAIENAPGQEMRQAPILHNLAMRGGHLAGSPVDFSHGDVNSSAFAPAPGALEAFVAGVDRGGAQAYTEYRGSVDVRRDLANKLGDLTGRCVRPEDELIVSAGTQSALFLAIAATVAAGDKVAIVQPDYFANRRLVAFMGAEALPIELDYLGHSSRAGLNLDQLKTAFELGAKTFVFSNPNNPSGVVYSKAEIEKIAELANCFGVTVIVDQLYCRLLYSGHTYVHLRGTVIDPRSVVTILGPSKTESLSGYRLGVAFGSARLITRMEQVQAITSLRAPGYCQAVLHTWFAEPDGWLTDRIARHQVIRDEIVEILKSCTGITVRRTEAGSYLFPSLPSLTVPYLDFVRILRHQASVTVTPGTEFGSTSHSSIRLNFSQNREAAADAIQRMVVLVDRYRA